MTHDPCFFGYGSLVNCATHNYVAPEKACAHGWTRAWRSTQARPFAYLTAVPRADVNIHGLVAAVPNADWGALDEREDAYDRVDATQNVTHARADTSDIAIYAVPDHATISAKHPILLSYLDVVVQGYLQQFGPNGADHFFETTEGWDRPVLDDRLDPIYPRHQILTNFDREIVDLGLKRLKTERIST